MTHGMRTRHLSKGTAHRKAMFINMATSLFTYERIETTLPKAKELRTVVEPLITIAKAGGDQSRRLLLSRLNNNKVIVDKLMETFGKRYSTRAGGYTRILKAGVRFGDMAKVAIIELVDRDTSIEDNRRKKREAVAKKKAAKEENSK